MNSSKVLSHQGHRMLQLGIGHFIFSGVEGFAIPLLRSPALGLAVHRLSALQGVMLLALGLFWPRLRLGVTASRVAYWTYIYSSVATLVPYVLAAVWGAGNTTIPQAAGPARGNAHQETAIKAILYSAAAPFFVAMGIVLWGLRIRDEEER